MTLLLLPALPPVRAAAAGFGEGEGVNDSRRGADGAADFVIGVCPIGAERPVSRLLPSTLLPHAVIGLAVSRCLNPLSLLKLFNEGRSVSESDHFRVC